MHAKSASTTSLVLTSCSSWTTIVTSKAPTEEAKAKVEMLTDYLKDHKNVSVVPDPYYGGTADFDYALDLIEDACSNLLNE